MVIITPRRSCFRGEYRNKLPYLVYFAEKYSLKITFLQEKAQN